MFRHFIGRYVGGPGSPRPAVLRPNYVIMEMLNFVSDSSQAGSLPFPGNVDSWLARISIRMSWAVCRPGDCYNAQQDVGRLHQDDDFCDSSGPHHGIRRGFELQNRGVLVGKVMAVSCSTCLDVLLGRWMYFQSCYVLRWILLFDWNKIHYFKRIIALKDSKMILVA